ncbi:MAG: ABC-F family ATP-binding cassette domain-containing protein [Eubacteriales bacterium]
MILTCQSISKTFIDQPILKDISFHIEEGERTAIIGMNGAGKTTLLRIITGEIAPDSGTITCSKDTTCGYLAQHTTASSDATIYDELLSVKEDLITLEHTIRSLEEEMHHANDDCLENILARYTNLTHEFEQKGGYLYKSELIGVLKGLGFEESEFHKLVNTLSGGQKTRVSLGKLLLQKPNLILLDEPTNHLDMNSIAWLETYLQNYKGSVILVSHDRYFLDKVTEKVIELEHHTATVFRGNYSDYALKKEHLRITQRNAYLNQQKELKHQEDVIEKLRSFNREKSIKRAESRTKLLDKVERLEKPQEEDTNMRLRLSPALLSGNDVLSVTNLTKSFGEMTLFSDLSFALKRGDHTALIGNNGSGKTTLLKIINDLQSADMGEVVLGSNVHIGYYDQEHNVLHSHNTIFEEISNDYPKLTHTQIRNTLASFLFSGDDVFKQIGDLSGGERGRVSLAKLMLSNANFLILDEPTNHLDLYSKEILEDAINAYEGTIFYVSHDRYFINRTAKCILELEPQALSPYIGNYDYYMEKKKEHNGLDSTSSCAKANTSESKLDWKSQKEEQALLRKQENDLRKCEEEIHTLELELDDIHTQMNLSHVATDVTKLQELSKEQESLTLQLEQLYEDWEYLSTSFDSSN